MIVQDHTAPGYVVEYALVLIGDRLAFGRICSCGYFLDDEDAEHGECE